MSLSEGTKLGSYEITSQLGAGGMGEVYRATDTKLGREVAIKTLPAALASDKDRLARFERMSAGNVSPGSWSPGGRVLLFGSPESGIYSWSRETDQREADGRVELLVPRPSQGVAHTAAFSPDGRWFVFSDSNPNGFQLYAYPYPMESGGRQTITTDGGVSPVWSTVRNEVIFVDQPNQIVQSVEVRTEPRLSRGNPVELFPVPAGARMSLRGDRHPRYDVAADGSRLLVPIAEVTQDGRDIEDQQQVRQIIIAVNWFEELRDRVPTD